MSFEDLNPEAFRFPGMGNVFVEKFESTVACVEFFDDNEAFAGTFVCTIGAVGSVIVVNVV